MSLLVVAEAQSQLANFLESKADIGCELANIVLATEFQGMVDFRSKCHSLENESCMRAR